MYNGKPNLYIHVGQATHFLQWELSEFEKYFNLIDHPSKETTLLAFGPDVLGEAATLPAKKRFIVLFPGFGHNPVHNIPLRREHRRLIKSYYDAAFINPGPLQIAYEGLENIELYPFSVNERLFEKYKPRKKVKKLIHISNDGPQKDWERSEKIMKLTGLKYEIFPPRKKLYFDMIVLRNNIINAMRRAVGLPRINYLPHGYVSHQKVINKYYSADAFIHIAAEINNPNVLDGKYTASLIEAGMSGCIIFWHDTFNLGNDLKTVFNVSLDEKVAAREIKTILKTLNVAKHSNATRQEMMNMYNTPRSVKIRSMSIIKHISR